MTSTAHNDDPLAPLALPAANATFQPRPQQFTPPFALPATSMHADMEGIRQTDEPCDAAFLDNSIRSTAGNGNVQLQVTVKFADHESRLGFLKTDTSPSAPEGVRQFSGIPSTLHCPRTKAMHRCARTQLVQIPAGTVNRH